MKGLDFERFRRDSWRQEFVLSAGAAEHLLDQMPSVDQVRNLLGQEAINASEGIHFVSFPPSNNPKIRSWLAADSRVDCPATTEPINLPEADRWFSSLRPLAQSLQKSFHCRTNLQLFYGRQGSGLAPHSDIHDSFVIQIAGRKRWQVTDPERGSSKAVSRTLVLNPGDFLYKPSGGMHATESLDEFTLSLTASLITHTAAEVLTQYLSAQLLINPGWNTAFPPRRNDKGARALLTEAISALPEELPTLEQLLAFAEMHMNDSDSGL